MLYLALFYNCIVSFIPKGVTVVFFSFFPRSFRVPVSKVKVWLGRGKREHSGIKVIVLYLDRGLGYVFVITQ